MYAWLIVNGFIHTEKFQQIFDWLVLAAKAQGLTLEVVTNTQLLPGLALGGAWENGGRRPQFAIFWDKDIRLAQLLEKRGLRLFNSAHAIAVCDDKAATFLELEGTDVCIPRTVIAPKTFRPQYPQLDFLDGVERTLSYPMVLKECFGSFGQQVYLVKNRAEAVACIEKIGNRPFLFQEYIASSAGHDIRIQMVGEQAVTAMYRYNANDFRANVTNGGSMKPYEPTEEQLRLARTVMRTLGLDFAGIDLLFGAAGEPVLCEVNSNAHFVNICKCTGVNAAEAIVQHCIREAACGN